MGKFYLKNNMVVRDLNNDISFDFSVFESFDEPVLLCDLTDKKNAFIVECNTAAIDFFEFDIKNVIGKKVEEIFPQVLSNKFSEKFDETVESGIIGTFNGEIGHGDAIRHFRSKLTPFTDKNGGKIFVLVNITELSTSKNLTSALIASESKYRRLHNSMMDAYVSTDMNGNIIEVNDSYLKMLGYSESEILKKTYRDLTPEKWHSMESTIISEQILQNGYSEIYEKEYFHKSGRIIPVELRTFLLTSDNGKPNAMWAIVRDISERKRAEEKLEKEVAFSNTLINASPAFIVGISTEGETVFINESFLVATGFKLEEVISKNYNEVFVPEQDISALEKVFTQIIKNKDATINENHIKKKNGELLLVEWHGRPIFNEAGEVEFLIGIGTDITERKRAEELRDISERRMRTLVDIAPFGSHMWEAKADGSLLFLGENKSAKKILGLDNDHLIGLKIEEAFPYLANSDIPEVYRNVAVTGEPYFTEQLSYHDNRISGAFELHAMQFAPNKMVVFFMDITERKKAEEALRMSEVRYRRLHESIMDAIITVDKDGFMKDVNTVFTEMIGYTSEELSLMTYYDITPVKWHSIESDIIKKEISEKGYTDVFEKEYIKKDGTVFPAELRVFQIKDDDGRPNGMIGIVRDISVRKQLENKLQNYVKDLERSNKELEQFAYVASHDLQEPLRMVSSFTQLLAQKYRDRLDQNAMEYIHYAVDGANRMQRLINDLLAYSRVQTKGKEFAKVDMHLVIGQAVSMLSQTISSKNALITNGELPTVLADESQMVQLFMNLISNAVKFCKTEPMIYISAVESEFFWIFSVKDNGIGIEKQYFNKIFQIFQRLHTKDEYIGTGIGLALCQRIIERHGGKIWLESEPGTGTIFYFSLPKERSNQS